eukprot:6472060-Amphidinium_carterae.1
MSFKKRTKFQHRVVVYLFCEVVVFFCHTFDKETTAVTNGNLMVMEPLANPCSTSGGGRPGHRRRAAKIYMHDLAGADNGTSVYPSMPVTVFVPKAMLRPLKYFVFALRVVDDLAP